MTGSPQPRRRGAVSPYEKILNPSRRRLRFGLAFLGLMLAGAVAWESAFTIVSVTIIFVAAVWAVWHTR